jgi:hypothetical protein
MQRARTPECGVKFTVGGKTSQEAEQARPKKRCGIQQGALRIATRDASSVSAADSNKLPNQHAQSIEKPRLPLLRSLSVVY